MVWSVVGVAVITLVLLGPTVKKAGHGVGHGIKAVAHVAAKVVGK